MAHNPDAALYLSEKIDEMFIKGKIYAVIGMFRDKDISGTVFPLKTKIDYWYASPLKNSRTATIDQLQNTLPINNTFFSNSIDETYKKLRKLVKKEDVILVFGSFVTVAEFIIASNIQNHIILGNTCL
ncbi:glutamate ligase domain-containing protein [Buchnera aphidicola]|uniref:glutamate ligase domain-containing protein n=1 Tax=Buchnera aphidicola TaxID=9 RepID=UPI000ABB6731|nr:hypothetical protein [Buchnera aphidicola]